MSLRANARHAAAHAVVGIRLGLPLVSVDVRLRQSVRAGATLFSAGHATYEQGCVERWEKALLVDALRGEARARLQTYAIQLAAGLYAEGMGGTTSASTEEDLAEMARLARTLTAVEAAVTASPVGNAHEVGRAWGRALIRRAHEELERDAGAAWDRVRFALERKRGLDGAEVRALVEGQ